MTITSIDSVIKLATWVTLPFSQLCANPFQSYTLSWKGWSSQAEEVDKRPSSPAKTSNQALKMIGDMLIICKPLIVHPQAPHHDNTVPYQLPRHVSTRKQKRTSNSRVSEEVPSILSVWESWLQLVSQPRGIFSKNKQLSREHTKSRGGLQEATG